MRCTRYNEIKSKVTRLGSSYRGPQRDKFHVLYHLGGGGVAGGLGSSSGCGVPRLLPPGLGTVGKGQVVSWSLGGQKGLIFS